MSFSVSLFILNHKQNGAFPVYLFSLVYFLQFYTYQS